MQIPLLFLTVFVIATCGLGYELIAGAVASYLLGDSVTQFSTAIGLYMFALGIGAYLSRFLDTRLPERFVDIELAVALLGGYAAAILMITFAHAAWFRPVLYGTILVTGTLVGLEVPLLLRILKSRMEFKELVARVLTVDYVGALAASLLFPLLMVPRLGLMRTSLAFGLANALVALWSTFLLREGIPKPAGLRARCALVIALLLGGFIFADRLTSLAEDGLYSDEVIAAKTSPYQRIVVTKGRGSFQLFLNGNLQFSSADEYRYHEALVHPAAMAATASLGRPPKRVLVLGGGDGLAARELLRYPSVEEILLVDLDKVMTDLAASLSLLKEQNGGSLRSPKLRVINDDAMHWLDEVQKKPLPQRFDLAIVDFPDPSSFAVGKLYTTHLYRRLRAVLDDHGAIAVQSTSPLFARRSYWCIMQTLAAAGFRVHPYHAFIPSFGEWGFALAQPDLRGSMQTENRPPVLADKLPEGLRYVGSSSLAALFVLSPDMGPLPVATNRLNNQALVSYYEHEWRRWN